MELSRHGGIEKDLRDLKRFPAPRESLEAWERLFCLKGMRETPAFDAFPGFGGMKVFKGRVVPLKENVGKSKGYRVIVHMVSDDCFKILVFSRHGVYHDEQDLIDVVKERLIS